MRARSRLLSAEGNGVVFAHETGYTPANDADDFALGEGAMDADMPAADLAPVIIEAFDLGANEPDEPPFDPPEFDAAEDELALIVASVSAAETAKAVDAAPLEIAAEPIDACGDDGEEAVDAEGFYEEPPPFDPPDEDEEPAVFSKVRLPALNETAPAPAELLLVKSSTATSAPRLPQRTLLHSDETVEAKAPPQPVPPISIHIFWDRAEMGAVFAALETDKRMARASGGAARGGLDAAIARYSDEASPDLLIVDTDLGVPQLLVGLDRLAEVLDARTRLMIVGAVNDIGLLRELALRGVSEYFVPPVGADAMVESICALFASVNTSRVVAVMGARGGVGSSTVAQNIAWSIAERQQLGAVLVDLDIAFGSAAFHMQLGATPTLATALEAPEDQAALERSVTRASPRFQILAAPANVAPGADIGVEALAALIGNARRMSPYVVLDLPHHWAGWVKHALALADEVLIVSAPDLAGLAATKNLLEQAKVARPGASEPMLALSMVGVAKRPEIRLKDFAEAAGVAPIASIAFDPLSFGEACGTGLMLCEAAPKSPAAAMMDAIATVLTGREVIARKTPVRERFVTRVEAPTIAPVVERVDVASGPDVTNATPLPAVDPAPLELTTLAPPQSRPSRRACSRAAARRRDEERKQRPRTARPGLVRAALAAVTLIALGAWYAQNGAEATTTSAPAPAPAPIDLNERYAAAESMLRSGETGEAVALMQRVAQAGLPAAQYRLAKFYEGGEVLARDLEIARAWTERAARGGHAQAMHDLGVYYARGEGGVRDDASAFRWFRQAAQHGFADSQYNLGVMYEQGRGVSANVDEALFWFTLAAGSGDADAAARVTAMETLVTPMQIEQAQARVAAFGH
ncbi:MAG: SEL1-like repeat protein [Caulobacterales bacterium]|nr:SEL1-like repeat protein [Caulobacterales bacterium]